MQPTAPDPPIAVGHRTRSGISWNLAGGAATNGMRLIVLAVLGRLLTSTDFGIVAAAVSVNAIVYGIRDIGIGPALIQRKHLDDGHLTTVFAMSTYLGLALTAVVFVAAPWIAELFHAADSVNVMYALGLLFVLRNITVTSRMICRREMNFRLLTIVETASFTIGSLTAMVCAATIGGPWSLVIGYWVEELIVTALYLHYYPPKWSLRVDLARLRELLGFGAGQTITQVTNVIALYGDNVVVGRSLGPSALGFYSRAFDLVKFPALVFATIAGHVLFSAFSRIQDDLPRLAANFRRVAFANALVLLPGTAALIVLAPETIRILMGPNWSSAVLPFQILAVTIMLRTNQRLAMLVATSAGGINGVAVSFLIYVVVLVGGAAISVRWGIAGVASTTAAAVALLWLQNNYLAIRVSRIPVWDVLRAHAPGLGLAIIVVACAWPAAVALRSFGLGAASVFALVMLLAIGVCVVAVVLAMRSGRGDFGWLAAELRRFIRRTPRRGAAAADPRP